MPFAKFSLKYIVLYFAVALTSTSASLPGEICYPTDPSLRCEDPLTSCTKLEGSSNFTCNCNIGYATDPVAKKCIRYPLQPGDECHASLAPCPQSTNSSCSAGSLCACINGFLLDTSKRRCLPTPTLPGDICTPSGVPCTSTQSPTSCGELRPELNEHVCECRGQDEVTDVEGRRCLTKPSFPSDPCHPTLTPCQGVNNTKCENLAEFGYTCRCLGELVTHPILKECLQRPKLSAELCDPVYNLCPMPPLVEDPLECTHNNSNPQEVTICSCTNQLITDHFEKRCLKLPQRPGDPCHSTLTPCDAIEFSECHFDSQAQQSNCRCIEGYVRHPQDNNCVKLPTRPGEFCHPLWAPCSTVQDYPTLCESNSCQCTQDLITDPTNGRCLAVPSGAGDICDRVLATCDPVPNTECSYDSTANDFLCRCKLNFILNPRNGSCLSLPQKAGDPCDPFLPLPCDAVVNATECASKGNGYHCKCNGPLVNHPEERVCLSLPQFPLDPCHPTAAPCSSVNNTQCIPELITGAFKCFCNNGLTHDALHKRCIRPPIAPGDHCQPDLAPCTLINNTHCALDPVKGYFCKCNNELITEDRSCFPSPNKPGDRCSREQFGCDIVANTSCTLDTGILPYSYCKCGAGYYTDFEAGSCIPLPTIPGDSCLPSSSQCEAVPDTICSIQPDSSYACLCKDGFFGSSLQEKCVRLPGKPLEQCERDEHCGGVNGTICFPSGNPDGTSHCVCLPGEWDLSPDFQRCKKKPETLFADCEASVECSKMEATFCDLVQRRCNCLSGAFPSATLRFCLFPVARLGLSCRETRQCSEGIGKDAVCDNGRCECAVGYVPDNGNTACLPTTDPENPNPSCRDSSQCWPIFGNLSMCNNGYCECFENATLIENTCHKKSFLNDECQRDEECLAGGGNLTICNPVSGTCVCSPLAIIDEDGRSCKFRGLGSSCNVNSECNSSIYGGACHAEKKICVCTIGMKQKDEFTCSISNGNKFAGSSLLLLFTLVSFKVWG